MDFEKQIRQGKRTALKNEKDHVLVTFQATRKLRDAAAKKTANLSDFLRRCMEKLVDSDIDKKITRLQDDIIDDVIDNL
jgi:DNA/RNA-binding domain of Phe-tRNA-synthetase-like protein